MADLCTVMAGQYRLCEKCIMKKDSFTDYSTIINDKLLLNTFREDLKLIALFSVIIHHLVLVI